jgi:hypothetical protein
MEKLANAPISTLSGSITNSATALTVTSASTFPTTGTFRVLIDDEIIKVTGVSGTTFTIVRGQESTTAVSHGSGATVTGIVTKNSLDTVFGEQLQYGLLSARPAAPQEGATWCDTDSLYQYIYHNGNWELTNPIYVPAANQIDLSAWTGVNLSGTTWASRAGVLNIRSVTTSGTSIAHYHKALPAAPYKLNICVKTITWQLHWHLFGIALHDVSSGKFKLFEIGAISNAQSIIIEDYNTYNSYSSTPAGKSIWLPDITHLQIEDDNTDWYFRFSMDGVNWVLLYQCTRNTFLTPTDVALVTNQNSGLSVDRLIDVFAYWEG